MRGGILVRETRHADGWGGMWVVRDRGKGTEGEDSVTHLGSIHQSKLILGLPMGKTGLTR